MKISKKVMKVLLAIIFIIPFLLITEYNVDAARFIRENNRVVYDYSDISDYLVRVGGVLEVTYVDPNKNKTEPVKVNADRNGKYYLDRNGTYTIRQLLPNDRTLGQSFYQTIVTTAR